MATIAADPPARTRAGRRAWAGLAVLALPTLLLSVDNTVLLLALPHLTADLAPGPLQLLWIMDVYGFMMAGLLITMGALGDRIGHRRLLLAGALAFGAASALAAYAPTAGALVAARALLGIAGATLMPSALALINDMFRDARDRAVAIGVFTGCFMGGAALGPVLGGALLESYWWGSVFLLGVPVMVLLLAAAPLVLPGGRGPGGGRLDPASSVLSMAAVLPAVYGLKEIAVDPADPVAYAALGAAAVAGALFVRRQRRLADPLLDTRLFRDRVFASALVIVMAGAVMQSGVYLYAGQHLQSVEGLSPLRAGLWLVPPALALVAGSLAAPVVARRVRPGLVLAGGLTVTAAGLAGAAWAGGGWGLIAGVTVAFLGASPLGALGLGMIVSAAPAGRAGAASAVAEASGEFGIALGIATLGSVGTAVYRQGIAVPDGVPADRAAAAADSVGGAASAAEGLAPPRLAADLLAAAHDAFGEALTVVVGTSAVLAAGLAVFAAVLLRRLPPVGSEAEPAGKG
ncbi:MFS transporter [Spirillospora sp. NPDC127200]